MMKMNDNTKKNTKETTSTRRQFLQSSGFGAIALGAGLGWQHSRSRLVAADSLQAETASRSLIGSISREILFEGRTGSSRWFHPRACVEQTANGAQVLMTLQSISGSDIFGPVHWTESLDRGKSWSSPKKIPGLGRQPFDSTHEVGVCDVTPQFHLPTQTTIAMGHNVYYREGILARPQLNRWPVYTVRKPGQPWSVPQKLDWKDPRGAFIYTCNCGQRLVLDNGDLLIALTYGSHVKEPRYISTIRCTYDGAHIKVAETGNALHNKVKRGLLEPSLTRYKGRFHLTIRAEDDRGYVASSEDGLQWNEEQPWCWEDGEPLVMSTTQQHWLEHSDALYLVYTRKTEENARVIRWRAPIYLAEVDTRTMRLKRATEQVVLPLVGDARKDPRGVAIMGNFNITHLDPSESWVTVGETMPYRGYRGDTLLARIRWTKPNLLVTENRPVKQD